ncbi:hypothetical protein DAPPUDRAFT_113947 [Daphnia pulex]|uniref:Uncharacterized protein n=1 Tax=Daphnia pulex TaxID=6669 RepID=E9HGK5_DAPPU|nr:hypothetical protein DAPPUDRAFT_113947 [Daphnia pulex]|eukprot:EFX69100.1 hypothetical protein DAPPUDRAFT_113947 [Daphnia pulex]
MSWVVSESGPWFAQPLQHPEFPKVAAKAVAVPKADVALKAPAVPKAWKKVVLADGLISKLSEVISESNSREEKDKSYNKFGGWQLKIWVYEDSESQRFREILEILRDSTRCLRDSESSFPQNSARGATCPWPSFCTEVCTTVCYVVGVAPFCHALYSLYTCRSYYL